MIRRSLLRIGAMALLVVGYLTGTLQPVPSALAQDGAHCFPQTGQCISGRFRAYWEQNGGLAVFGYPITAARQEQNRDTGQSYLTQWFERNRFELHPENQPPYDVLLGRLGDDRLRQLGRNWQDLPRDTAPTPGCLWFAQTQFNVCDQATGQGFMTYWQTHGLADPALDAYGQSVALFGLPVSRPQLETNTAGDTVLTQWFERARFEWHPTKPDAFKVLLGLLGREVSVPAGAPPGAPSAPVTRVIDGDTIEVTLAGQIRAVRLIGVNTPETEAPNQPVECFGPEASAFTKALLEGKPVTLEKDVSETDRFGRLLRYVYRDGVMVNERLVREGYAQVSTVPPDVKYAERFLAAQRAAQAEKQGLWGACPTTAPPPNPTPNPTPTPTPGQPPRAGCEPSYPDVCIPPPPPDLDCGDIPHRNFRVLPPDPHRFDSDNDGIGCET